MKIICRAIILFATLIHPVFSYSLTEEGFQTLNIFTKILYYVEKDYVEAVDEKTLLQGAIRGMLSVLDPHSVYLNPKIYKHLRDDTSGVFGGVGLEITVRDGWVTVVSPVEGSPAQRAGIQPGDRILKINGRSTKGMDLGTVVKEMRGKKGVKVNLTIGRKGLKQPLDVGLKRTTIQAPSIRAELLEDKYLYVKMSSFQERTTSDLQKVLRKHQARLPSGFILDLRNNPGGLLSQAVEVCDLFLDKGVIVTTASRGKEIDRKEATVGEGEENYPMILIVNGGSASAAEIVAGALQDHHRALVLGTQTFGKGSVQSVVELEDDSALKLTIARYFTPSGRSIQAEGIKPDVVVEPIPLAGMETALVPERIREKQLKGHLEGAAEEKAGGEVEVFREAPHDYQKEVALNYLKSWRAFQQQRTENRQPRTESRKPTTENRKQKK